MDMAAWLDEMNYRLLVCAADGVEAADRVAIVAHWASEQGKRLATGQSLRIDSDHIVAEILAERVDLADGCPRATQRLSA